MKRIKVLFTMIAVLTAAAVGMQSTPAFAFPSDYFNPSGAGNGSSGYITWYNRDVRINGTVTDYNSSEGGYTQIRFDFFLTGHTDRFYTTTRTISDDPNSSAHQVKPYDFTVNQAKTVPRGGIGAVNVSICSSYGPASCDEQRFVRPPS